MVDPFSTPAVFEYDQVITAKDLYKLKGGLELLVHQSRFMDIGNAVAIDTMLEFTEILIQWLHDGKPDQVKLLGDSNETL